MTWLLCMGIEVIFCLFFCFLPSSLEAQSMIGVTHIPDSSYTTYSAYQKLKKAYPSIKIVPQFNYKNVEIKKDIIFCSVQHKILSLDAFIPKGIKGKRIAIIIVHGGGWRSGGRSQHWPLAEALANKGYVCFTPEYRLSTEALFPAGIYDLKTVIRWVRANASKFNVDTSKIVVAGFSSGGEMAAFLGTTGNMPLFEGNECYASYSSRVNAIVDMDGILSFVSPDSRESNDSIGRISAATYWFGYNRNERPGLWLAASPLTYAGENTPPTLFINSSVTRMHAGRNEYIKILNGYGIYTEVHTFKNATHSFPLFYPWFDPIVTYIDSFLKKVLQTH